MKYKPIEKPNVLDCFFHGEIIDWKFRSRLTPTHGKYAIRFEIIFEDGTVVSQERGGFSTLKEGEKAKERIIADLHHRTFVCFSVTVKEFMEYWFYYYMIDEKEISYNTFSVIEISSITISCRKWDIEKCNLYKEMTLLPFLIP